MSILANDVAEFAGSKRGESGLGTVLEGRFSDLDVDSVEEVRRLRERE